MAAITPGTAGTLKSVTLENAFHEALSLVSLFEQDSTKNTQALTRVTMSFDVRTSRATGTFTFALTKAYDEQTDFTSFPIVEHLTGTSFSPGTGGTLKSPGLCAAVVKLCELIQDKEQITSKNPSAINSITSLNYDSEALQVSGSFDYSIVGTVNSTGGFTSTAKTYLLD